MAGSEPVLDAQSTADLAAFGFGALFGVGGSGDPACRGRAPQPLTGMRPWLDAPGLGLWVKHAQDDEAW